ncbi:NLI interacting factor-like phosphatase, putative [Plasmodium yoelii]|uniref:protein-serine/threonine phosphatase n=2 Tax=Plasmodium yoelii TaxID=5861 RepID=A0AAE9WVA2_PLAYO|nr:NLI interacting factor-like phosphatase, putative [Plasmodium yoelii]WBY59139.1 NLI interacting factor-like phosphatase [Plasmodium yoelii yoelii]CDU19309.1 phosphatase, putative [Plasmodium yoelii]VTZ79944.1 NLI interacting factor-like phosphatase, putative [Plasmodium yoelii]|eukprot:XP_723632.3 NLI interacting factor-like phosphatase, putative [Plasmodium yoelii]
MDTNKVYLPKNITLPCKLKWAVDDNSMVSSNQIIAFIIETKNENINVQNDELINNNNNSQNTNQHNFDHSTNEQNNANKCINSIGTLNDENVKNKENEIYAENTKNDPNYQKIVNSQNNVINFILNSRNTREIKESNHIFLRCNNSGRINILKKNISPQKDEYVYIDNPNELLCEINDEECKHEIIFSGLCANCFMNQEEINKNKNEKYFLSPGFITNEKKLFINTDKAIDLEKERIQNIINNKKLCLVLDLDNTLLQASFCIHSVHIEKDVINITTDFDDDDFVQMYNHSRDENRPSDNNPENGEINIKTENGPLNDGKDCYKKLYNILNQGIEKDEINSEMLKFFFNTNKKKNNKLENDVYHDIKMSYEEYLSFLAKINTLNLLKYNGKYIHYEDLNDEAIKAKIKKFESSVLKTTVKYDKGLYTIYYKLRPGVIEFLQKMNQKYEIYLYTMGTIEHAKSCLFLLDPLKKFFGNRIFSRKDCTNGMKHLNRILPTYRSISICVDDSEYIWKETNSCIKVHAYNYFPEIQFLGDIKKKTYFLTKFFSMAQSYLNFSTDIYRFINFKCNEYEEIKKNYLNNIMINNIYTQNLSIPYLGPMGIQMEGPHGNMNNTIFVNNSNIVKNENTIENGNLSEENKDNISNGVNNIIDNTLSINFDEGNDENSNEMLIDLEKEFETDNENDSNLKRKSHNSNKINLVTDHELVNYSYPLDTTYANQIENTNESILNIQTNTSNIEEANNNAIFASLENDTSYLEGISGGKDMSEIQNNNLIFYLDQDNSFLNKPNDEHNIDMVHYSESTESLNNNTNISNEQNILADNLDQFYNKDENDDLDLNLDDDEDMLFLNDDILNNDLNKKTKKKKKNNSNDINKNDNASKIYTTKHPPLYDEQNMPNNINQTNYLQPKLKYISPEDEMIFKFISEKTFKKYENYVTHFLDNYFKERDFNNNYQIKKESQEPEKKIADSMISEITSQFKIKKEEPNNSSDMFEREKKYDGSDIHEMNNNHEEQIQKSRKGRKFCGEDLIEFQNVNKKKKTNLEYSNENNNANKSCANISNNKLNYNDGNEKYINEYYETFFIPKNLKENNFQDNDKQLYYLVTILDEIHYVFYKLFDDFKANKINEKNEDSKIYNYFLRYPIVRTILREFRKKILNNCTFNISHLPDDIQRSDFIDNIFKLGGFINNNNYSHMLTINNPLKTESAEKTKCSNLMLIERALYTWKFPDAKYYDMNTWKQPYRNFWDVLEYEEKN